jgi:hypothetical protein
VEKVEKAEKVEKVEKVEKAAWTTPEQRAARTDMATATAPNSPVVRPT